MRSQKKGVEDCARHVAETVRVELFGRNLCEMSCFESTCRDLFFLMLNNNFFFAMTFFPLLVSWSTN